MNALSFLETRVAEALPEHPTLAKRAVAAVFDALEDEGLRDAMVEAVYESSDKSPDTAKALYAALACARGWPQ